MIGERLLLLLVDLVLPLVVGYLLGKYTRLQTAVFDRMLALTIIFVDPVLSCLSFWVIELDARLLLLPVLGVVMVLAPGMLAFVRANRKYEDPLKRGSYLLAVMLSNRGVAGMLTVYVLYGEAGYALVSLFALLNLPVVQLLCYPMAEHYYRKQHAIERTENRLKTLFTLLFSWKQIPLLGIIVGVLLNLGGAERPPSAGMVFPYLVHLSAWMALLPVGQAIQFDQMRDYWKQTADVVGVKFFFTPLIMWVIGRLVGLEGMALNVLLVLSLAPTAINAVITARLFRLNTYVPLTAFILTTSIYVVLVLPLIVWWFG